MSTPSRRRAYGVSERILFVANQVEAFNRNREEHREVDVTFRYVDVETFKNQGKAHQNQERERQHFYRRMAFDKSPIERAANIITPTAITTNPLKVKKKG